MASPTYGAPVSIDGPPPSPPALTLVGAARTINPTDDRWINGAAIWPYPLDLPDTFDPCQSLDSSGHAKAAGTPTESASFGSFAVLMGITCTTRGVTNPEEWQARAKKLLEAREHWGIEHEFWTGDLKPDNPHLAQSSATSLNSGNSTSPAHALSLLESEIGIMGGNGVVHMRPAVFSLLTSDGGGGISVTSGVAKTMLGTPIVPGVGYIGTGSNGDAVSGTQEYAYATGPVEIRRSEVFIVPGSISEATDRAQNTTTFRAERYVLITWDQRIHAVAMIDREFTGYAS